MAVAQKLFAKGVIDVYYKRILAAMEIILLSRSMNIVIILDTLH